MIREAITNVLNEVGDDYLDISIKNAEKVINESNAKDFLTQNVEIYSKFDGTKLSLVRTDVDYKDTENPFELWVVSYKGYIIHPEEFNSLENPDYNTTVGVSQYKVVIDHIQKYYKTWKSVPKNTEFFIEFLMNKPTLTRKYTKLRELVLIGHGKNAKYTMKHGKISIKTDGLDFSEREKYAKILKINVPEKLFEGKLIDLPKGLNQRARTYFDDYKQPLEEAKKNEDYYKYYEITRLFFLSIPSVFGAAKEEGVVIHLSKPIKTPILKFVQDDQYDKELRNKIKQQYKMDIPEENAYWDAVLAKAEEFLADQEVFSNIQSGNLQNVLKILSRKIYKEWTPEFIHKKKSELNVKDDVMLTAKNKAIRSMPGNNGALVIGKFRVVTNGHLRMFQQALKNHDYLVVALVSNKETKKTLELRERMVKAVIPQATVITTNSGNIVYIMNKAGKNINTVFAGSDRVEAYKKQLSRTDVNVQEVNRTEEDESATKVIRNLADFNYFKNNTPKEIWPFHDELVKTYGISENFRKEKTMIKDIVENINDKIIEMEQPDFVIELHLGCKKDGIAQSVITSFRRDVLYHPGVEDVEVVVEKKSILFINVFVSPGEDVDKKKKEIVSMLKNIVKSEKADDIPVSSLVDRVVAV